MAKKEQKKPLKKPQTKKAVKVNKASARGKKTAKAAAPAKKTAFQAKKPAVQAIKAAAPEKTTAPKPTEVKKFLSIAEFADMTYLTEYGVMQWLKQGKLKGQQNEKGDWQVDASNLEIPNVKRLVR